MQCCKEKRRNFGNYCRSSGSSHKVDYVSVLPAGKAKITGEIISNYESAIKLFKSISGWRDADEQINACQKKIEEIKAKEEAERLEKERKAEIERKEAEHIAKRNKKIKIIATLIVLNTFIIPK